MDDFKGKIQFYLAFLDSNETNNDINGNQDPSESMIQLKHFQGSLQTESHLD